MIDFSKLDKVIHEKGRLSIVTLLASRAEPWPFQDLKAELGMSDGNLITHLRTLGVEHFIMDFGHPLTVEPALRFAEQVIVPMKES